MSKKLKADEKDLQKFIDAPSVHFINHESRISRLESVIDSINATLIRLENKMDSGFTQIVNKFDRVDGKFERIEGIFERLENKIDSNFKWTIGIILTATITLFGAILHKG